MPLTNSAPLTASIDGVARGPAGLVGHNSSGLIGNNAAGYRVQRYDEAPVPRAMVYLTHPDGRFYVQEDGSVIAGMTDDSGSFRFPKAPAGAPVVVNVMLGGQRRLLAFLVPAAGPNRLELGTASTLVGLFALEQAALRQKTPAIFDLAKLGETVTLTQTLLDDLGMGPVDPARNQPDLSIPNHPAIVERYVGALAKFPPLAQAWQAVLGYRPLSFTRAFRPFTLTGGSGAGTSLDYQVGPILAMPGTPWVVAAFGSASQIAVYRLEPAPVEPAGSAAEPLAPEPPAFVRGARAFESSRDADPPGSALPALNRPEAIAQGPDGSLLIADGMQAVGSPGKSWLVRVRPHKNGPNTLERLELDSPAGAMRGMAFDEYGNLYLADEARHVVRRIAAADVLAPAKEVVITRQCGPLNPAAEGGQATASCETTGFVSTASAPVVAGRDGTQGFQDGTAAQSLLFAPVGLAAIKGGILVADSGNARIRRLLFDDSGTPTRMDTYAGGGERAVLGGLYGFYSDDGAPYGQVGFRAPARLALDGLGRLAVADANRVVLLSAGHALTVVTSAAGARTGATDSRRVPFREIDSIAWQGTRLVVGTLNAPGMALVEIPE